MSARVEVGGRAAWVARLVADLGDAGWPTTRIAELTTAFPVTLPIGEFESFDLIDPPGSEPRVVESACVSVTVDSEAVTLVGPCSSWRALRAPAAREGWHPGWVLVSSPTEEVRRPAWMLQALALGWPEHALDGFVWARWFERLCVSAEEITVTMPRPEDGARRYLRSEVPHEPREPNAVVVAPRRPLVSLVLCGCRGDHRPGCELRVHGPVWEQPLLGELPRAVFVLDTETTGFGADARVIEVAGILVSTRSWKVMASFESFVRSDLPIHPRASGVHGIFDADIADAPTFEEVFPALLRVAGGYAWIAHNARFDADRIGFEVRRRPALRPLVGPFTPRVWCTLAMAKALWPDRSHKLGDLAISLGITKRPTHRALADVEVAVEVLRKAVEAHPDLARRGLDALLGAPFALPVSDAAAAPTAPPTPRRKATKAEKTEPYQHPLRLGGDR